MVTSRRSAAFALSIALAAASTAVGCGSGSSSNTKSGNPEAVAAATGDIPDNQAFLTYRDARRVGSRPGGPMPTRSPVP
jgi:hypothetical protein